MFIDDNESAYVNNASPRGYSFNNQTFSTLFPLLPISTSLLERAHELQEKEMRFAMASNNNVLMKILKISADVMSTISVTVFLAQFWWFYFAGLKGPRAFSEALSILDPVIDYDSVPFLLGSIWLICRYSARIDQKLPTFLRTYWVAVLIFTCIALPVLLLKFRK